MKNKMDTTHSLAHDLHRHIVTVALAAFVFMLAGVVQADPVPQPPGPVVPPLFCFRITDIEKVPLDVTGDAFNIEFEVLNWTNLPATGLSLMTTVGSTALGGTAIPTITGLGVDPDGRGGPAGVGFDIVTPGVFDPIPIHSGHGRGDLPGLLNDWLPVAGSATTALWSGATGGTAIPNRDLLGAPTQAALDALIPGIPPTLDGLGDLAVDGGPLPYVGPPPIGGGPPIPDGSGNVLDGLFLTVNDFNVGETLSLNWFLLNPASPCGGVIGLPGPGPMPGAPAASCGNAFGFGIFNLIRTPLAGPFIGPAVFAGMTGARATASQFFDGVNIVMNPAAFAAEFGGGITAPFLNPGDNRFNATPNVPEPSSFLLMASSMLGLGWCGVRRRGL